MTKCQVCKKNIPSDIRTLRVDCLANIKECIPIVKEEDYFVEIKKPLTFLEVRSYPSGKRVTSEGSESLPPIKLLEKNFYTLKVCKKCRSNFLNVMKNWADGVQSREV